MDPITIAMGLAQFAPAIVKWITGSDTAEKAAGQVVEIAKQVTGQGDGAAALEAIKADPNVQLQFRLAVMANESELDKAFLADRQNARQREIELAKVGVKNDRANWMVGMAAFGTIGGFVSMTLLGYFKARHPDALNDGVFGALLAQSSTVTAYFGLCLRDAFQYEFGSSRSSANKDVTIQNLTK